MASQAQRPEQFAGLQEGALVLADISGYTSFVAQTEVDHSWSILHELLDTVVRSMQGRMDVSQVEGDAILFITGMSTPEVIAAIETTFVAFKRRLRDMDAVTTCPCSACANIGILKLKFVVHHGKFSRQRLGNVEQLHGADVIVAHRLLKNKVPSKEYLLVTDAVLERLPDETRKRFTPHSEEFDLGVIRGGYEEITYLWDKARAIERQRVLREEALVNAEVVVDAPRDTVYRRMLRPDVMERYLFSDDVKEIPGARGEELGAEFHCHHGGSYVSMRVVSLEPNSQITLTFDQPSDGYVTTYFTDAGDGKTSVVRSFIWEQSPDANVAANVLQMFQMMAVAADDAIKSVFDS